MKIKKLTPEQEKKVQEYFQTYLSHGLSTEPANKELAEKAISEMYRKLGKEVPEFIWKPSPKSCIDYINENQLSDQLENQLEYQLKHQLREHLSDQLENQLEYQLSYQLSNQVYDQLYHQLSYQLSYQLRVQLKYQLRLQLRYQLENKYTFTYLWGQFDLYWVALYKFCFEQLPVTVEKEDLESLNLFDQIGKSCSFWYPYEKICVISDRPEVIHLNEKGELHNESGKAIKFRDNWGIYSINGCQISKEIFDMYKSIPKSISKSILDSNKIRFKISINQKYISFVSNNNFLNKLNHPKPFKSIFNHLMKHYYI